MTTAAAAVQAIVGGPQHVTGEKGKWARSTATGGVSVLGCPSVSQLSKKRRRMLETKISYDWQIGYCTIIFDCKS